MQSGTHVWSRWPTVPALLLALLAGGLSACATGYPRQTRSSALEYLYPRGASPAPPADVTLRTPLRIGIAFAPAPRFANERISATDKQELLEKVAAAFRGRPGIGGVEVIPANHLTAREPVPPAAATVAATIGSTGFDELDRLKAAFGIDLMALVSYDQAQFSETGKSSWAYWTIVGLYVVKGEKNGTETMLDAVVYDIASRTLLFNAAGQSRIAGSATPIDVERALRLASDAGFKQATDDLIVKLGVALETFQKQAATGTVRGPGTPAIALLGADGKPVGGGEDTSGAFGAAEGIAILVLALLALRRG